MGRKEKIICFFCASVPLWLMVCTTGFAQEDATEYAKGVQDELAGLVEKVSPAFVNIGGGSGIAVSPDGLVLTNYHVAGMIRPGGKPGKNPNQLKVRMPGGPRGRSFDAKILWRDRFGDVCLLKLDTKGRQIPHVEMADSDSARVGQFAIALGTPFMTARDDSIPSVSFGVISALHRYIATPGSPALLDGIQTDAPVNPGNSGGPLLDLEGKLLGINAQIRVRHSYRINTGIGLAIPVNQIKRFIQAFKDVTDGSEVYHGQIGGLTLAKKGEGARGALVEKVAPGSTAEKAGFKPGDVIVRVESYTIFNWQRFLGVTRSYPQGATVEVALRRADEEHKLSVTLDPLAPPGAPGRPRPRPAKKAEPAQPYLGARLTVTPGAAAVTVERIVPGRPADKAGLKVDDIIIEFDGRKITSLEDMKEILDKKKPADVVKLKVLRGAKTIELELTLGKRPDTEKEK